MGRHALILGLTGGYCSGKSSAAAVLLNTGWTVIDVDALGHTALERSSLSVAALLGPSALKADGTPDRRAIGAMVFGDEDMLARYEAIVHPAMNALVIESVSTAGDRVCVDAALLYRLPIADACDAIIEVRSPLVVRMIRGRYRDGLGMRAILARIARQKPLWVAGRAYKAKTVIVHNAGSSKRFHEAVLTAVDHACSFARA